jgi:STE24 endopeptidase
MGAHRYRLPLAIAVAVVAAGAATLVLRPRNGLLDAAPVAATDYFSARELDRAEDYRGPQRLLGIAGLVVSAGTLAFVAIRPPRRVRRALERAGRRPLLGAAAAGASLTVVLVLVTLPFAAIGHERAVDVGLSTQSWGHWLGDVGKAAGVQAVLAAGGAAILMGLIRRFPRHWWLPTSGAVVALSAVFLFLSPIVIEPLFNRFEPLRDRALAAEIEESAQTLGVRVEDVLVADASRRTTTGNAYVSGLGPSKRVVLYDTLLDGRFTDGEIRAIAAHELAHVARAHLWKGLAWFALLAVPAVFLIAAVTERRGGLDDPANVPLALALAAVFFLATLPLQNLASRRYEAEADWLALVATQDPESAARLDRRLVTTNLGDPQPPAWFYALFSTHPSAMERIAMAEVFRDR